MSGTGAIVREAAASARSQPVGSVLTVAMAAGMCLAVLLTTGRTVAAEDAALAAIDAAGTRSIVVRASDDAGLSAGLLDRLQAVGGIEAVTGLGPIVDYRNAAVPGGTPIAVRAGYGRIGDQELLAPNAAISQPTVLASTAAADALGLRDGTGALAAGSDAEVVVAGRLEVPGHLAFVEPLVIAPSSRAGRPSGTDPAAPLTVLVVLVDAPHQVAPVAATVRGLLEGTDPTKVSLETSAQLAAIRAAIDGELGRYGRSTVLAVLAIATALVAANVLALVAMRRKDFGRRRALGATQWLIMGLLLTQTAILAAIGAALGVSATLGALAVMGDPLPDHAFSVAVAVAAVLMSTLATLPPAVYAARRDPLHELRVP